MRQERDEMNDYDAQFVREAILEVVERQVRDGEPPEVRQHLARLIGEGFWRSEAVTLIGSVMSREMFNALDTGLPFDTGRYLAALAVLPALPWEE